MVRRENSCLQFADPIVRFGKPQIWVAGKMAFGSALVISVMIQPPKCGSQSAERPGQPELRAAGRTNTTQLGLAGKGHSAFGFRLDFRERSSYRQTHRDRDVKTITYVSEVADPIRGVERPAH